MRGVWRRSPRLAAAVAATLIATLSQAPAAAAASSEIEVVREATDWIAGVPSRMVGSSGHDAVVERLLKELNAVPGVRVWCHRFPVVMPRVERAEMIVAEGPQAGRHRIHPLWPAGVRLNTTPAEGISGRLVYVGKATIPEVPASGLQGQIAVMELSGGDGWRLASKAGAAAILLLDSDEATQLDVASHFVPLPINVPRFCVSRGPLAEALRRGEPTSARIDSKGAWVEAEAVSIYALVAPRKDSPPRKALAIAVPLDSAGAVPELAPGADAAIDAAVGLTAVCRFAERPPARPLLFAFLDAQAISQLGVRQMLGALALTPQQREAPLKKDEKARRTYREARDRVCELVDTDEALSRLHQRRYRDIHPYVEDEADQEVVVIEAELQSRRLEASRAPDERKESINGRVRELLAERTRFRTAQAQMLSGMPIDKELRPVAALIWERTRARVLNQCREIEEVFAAAERSRQLRLELVQTLGLSPDGEEESPIAFLLGLDLSDAGVAVGPSRYCYFQRVDETANSLAFRSWIDRVVQGEQQSVWPQGRWQAVNLEPFKGLATADSHIVGHVATITSPATSFGVPAVTWATLDAPRLRVDTPGDRADRLDWTRLEPQIGATFSLLDALAADPAFAENAKALSPKWSCARGTVVDISPGDPVPRLPMAGYVTTLLTGKVVAEQVIPAYVPSPAGLRREEFHITGADGRVRFNYMPARLLEWVGVDWLCLQSYKLADDGSIIRAIDYRRADRGAAVRYQVTRGSTAAPLRGVVFTCREATVQGLFDPRFLISLASGTILDARSLGVPKRSNVGFYGGMMSCQLEPDLPWQLVLRAGITRNRMALLNMADPREHPGLLARDLATGFSPAAPLPYDPIYQGARDWFRLDELRLAEYRKAGITSGAIDQVRQRTAELLAEAEKSLDADDGAGFVRAAGAAMANESAAYQASLDTAGDVIRGAVFLLLVLVPFSYAMERLLVASPYIHRQILWLMLIFAVMTLVLWSFHPAFKISSQPLTVVMAFAVICLSLLVTSMVYGKFASELEKLRSGRAEESGAKTSRLGVLTTAVRLGIANMRKRKLRTALTGLTIVLITFALLCFVSTGRYADYRDYSLDVKAQTTGVLLRNPGGRSMPAHTLPHVRNALDREEGLVPRYWWAGANANWRLYVRNAANGQQVEFRAALALAPEESLVTAVAQVCPDWARFAAHGGCYMAGEHADRLGVRPGDPVVIAGQSLELIGVFDPAEFDRVVVDLDARPLTPVDYSALSRDEIRDIALTDLTRLTREEATGAGVELDRALPQLSSSSVVIVPSDTLRRRLPGAELRTIVITAPDGPGANRIARDLADRFAFLVTYGARGDQLRVLAKAPLVPSAPRSLLVPLLVGALIIFNTMLSSIAERRREVYVYTSLGLSPIHVGFLFLAEAMTYGLIGSIFGYVVGQGLATAFSSLGWLGGITLNYSGSQAIMIMLMVLAVVMVSSLVPAYLADRLAAPASTRSWQVPAPRDDTIRDVLPFTVTGRTANGVAAFLYEYLDAHREGAIGRFSTDNLRTFRASAGGLPVFGVSATVWLTPYDLGTRQEVRLMVQATENEDVYAIHIEMHRASGAVSTWYKLNRVFLGDLRRQLLGWRKLTAERVLAYLAEGRRILASAT